MAETEVTEVVRAHLQRIEVDEQVRILYACESGSRAWGFPSADSDYDVRFFYVRPTDWYLRIDAERDVLEFPKISTFIERELTRLETMAVQPTQRPSTTEELNQLFQAALKEVW